MASPNPPRTRRGMTLIEIAIVIAVLAILATLAMPSLAERMARGRLAGTAEMLALDMAEARIEAVQTGQPLYVVFEDHADWCYAVARTPGCGCTDAQACQLKVVRAADNPGVQLVEARSAGFDTTGAVPEGALALLRSAGSGHQLRVTLSPLGRPRICTSSGLTGYAGC